jgi:uncharacterized protein YpmB
MSNVNKVRIYRNDEVYRVISYIPKGHRHIRVYIETSDSRIVLQEATVSAILRAFIGVKMHPKKLAIELRLESLDNVKEGYAKYQLIETGRPENNILSEMNNLV